MDLLNTNNLIFIILIIVIGYYSIKYLFFVIIGFILGVYITYKFYGQQPPQK
jgi:hypothetical protein